LPRVGFLRWIGFFLRAGFFLSIGKLHDLGISRTTGRQRDYTALHFVFHALMQFVLKDGQELRVLSTRRLWLADQLLKKRPVMNHGLAQVFGAGLPPRLTKRALVGCTVIFENQWMIHGDIRRTLFKVANRWKRH
jgi:hypothetical protein